MNFAILEVSSCVECPFFDYLRDQCEHPHAQEKAIADTRVVPKHCPLRREHLLVAVQKQSDQIC